MELQLEYKIIIVCIAQKNLYFLSQIERMKNIYLIVFDHFTTF